VGSNFKPNQATASPGDVVASAPATTNGVNNTAALEARQNTTYYSSDDIVQLNTAADVQEAIDAQTSNAKQIQDRLTYSQSVDAEVKQRVGDALTTSGQAEADAIRQQYSSKGYEDPAKLSANLKLNTENRTDLTRKLLGLQATESSTAGSSINGVPFSDPEFRP
jgi:hypothetical protein